MVCDDYGGYNKLRKTYPKIKLQRCWAHARRKFSDILKSLDKQDIKDTVSYKIIILMNQLFKFEALYKEKELPISEILKQREKDQIPIINQLKPYIFDTPLSPNALI